MTISEIKKIFSSNGYSDKLAAFVCAKCPPWEIDTVVEMATEKKSEKELIKRCFLQWSEGVFDDLETSADYQRDNQSEAEHKYLSHCNPDGSFRFEDFAI